VKSLSCGQGNTRHRPDNTGFNLRFFGIECIERDDRLAAARHDRLAFHTALRLEAGLARKLGLPGLGARRSFAAMELRLVVEHDPETDRWPPSFPSCPAAPRGRFMVRGVQATAL